MIVITGCTGNIGRELLRLLLDKGADVRALAQNPLEASELEGKGFEVVTAEFQKPRSLGKAMKNAEKLFLLTPVNPNLVEHQGNLIDAAASAGLRHIVKLSGLDAHPESSSRILRWHAEVEQRIEASGINYTFLRPHYLMQNFLMFAPTITAEGAFYAPMQNGRIAAVDARDIAAVAAAVLTEDDHENRVYDLTGPEALSFRDMADKISSVQRRRVAYVDIEPDEARRTMRATGSSEWFAEAVLEIYAIYSEDLATITTDHIEQITGQRPRSFDEFAVDFADAFVRIKNHSAV